MTALSPDQTSTSAFAALLARIDAALLEYAQFEIGCPAQLAEAIKYSLLSPGKRLRPQLVVLSAEACGGSGEEALPAACAVEMVHAYSLVHDDLPAMDDDDLRRGRPTCHKVFGEATAILVGDALLARAFEVLAAEIQPPARAARCCAVLGKAAGATALVGGQAADLAGEQSRGEERQLAELESIHRRKTGALFVASVQIGGIVAGADAGTLDRLTKYGNCLGLAFQITDDILDVDGNQASIGKRVAKDAERGKLTFPELLGVDKSRQRVAELVEQAYAVVGPLGTAAAPLSELALQVGRRTR